MYIIDSLRSFDRKQSEQSKNAPKKDEKLAKNFDESREIFHRLLISDKRIPSLTSNSSSAPLFRFFEGFAFDSAVQKNFDLLKECNEFISKVHELIISHNSKTDNPSSPYYISYEDFNTQFKEEKKNPRLKKIFFKGSLFFQLPQNNLGDIDFHCFFFIVLKKCHLLELKYQLISYSRVRAGYICEKELEEFFSSYVVTTLPPFKESDDALTKYYVYHAVRKIMFHYDVKHQDSIPLSLIFESPILRELLRLYDYNWSEDIYNEKNWFSPKYSLLVYDKYIELDKDSDGLLSKTEFSQFRSSFVKPFIDRVFDCTTNYDDGKLDFKGFLEFILAIGKKTAPASIKYFWRIIDINDQGYINSFQINYFFREVMNTMDQEDRTSCEDIRDEIFDMISPVDPLQITFQDLMRSKNAPIVLSIFFDTQAYFCYDQRESTGSNGILKDTFEYNELP